VDDLQLNEASLDSKDQQGDAFCHPSAQTDKKQPAEVIKSKDTDQQHIATDTHAHTDINTD